MFPDRQHGIPSGPSCSSRNGVLRPPKPHWDLALVGDAGGTKVPVVASPSCSQAVPKASHTWKRVSSVTRVAVEPSCPPRLTPEAITKSSRASLAMAEHPKPDLSSEQQPCSPATPGHREE